MTNDKNLNDLNEKLARFRTAEQPNPATSSAAAQGMNTGIRAGSEFVVSVAVGLALGWGVDSWLHIKPWGLIGFLFLGVGTGFWGIYRITNKAGDAVGFASLQKPSEAAIKSPENDPTDHA